jgi:serine/threonine-protein kinase
MVVLGKYHVEHVLGEGGMGVVVAARHLDLGQLFAIKLLRPAALADAEVIERFLREARATARLRSEHVARVHDVGRLEDGAPYIVMEHLSGQDLRQVLRERGPLPPEEAVAYVYQACEAVAEAHSLGIVHRDLKPANLFLARRPSRTPCVKVLDFGISKDLCSSQSDGSDLSDLTKTGIIMGSPHYMAPEQLARSKDADPRSDIWSLGVILFELLTGARPFAAEGLMEVLTKIATMPPPRPGDLRPDLPPSIEAIVLKCLEKAPERRFQSVPELMAALQRVMTDERALIETGTGRRAELTGPTDLGAQTSKAWTGGSSTGRARGHVGLTVAVAMPIALLVGGGGAWLAKGHSSRDDAAAAVASGVPVVMAVTAPAEPAVAPATVVVPANTAGAIEFYGPSVELPAPVIAPSASAPIVVKPEPTGGKPKAPRAERPKTSAGVASSTAPKPSTAGVPGFDE